MPGRRGDTETHSALEMRVPQERSLERPRQGARLAQAHTASSGGAGTSLPTSRPGLDYVARLGFGEEFEKITETETEAGPVESRVRLGAPCVASRGTRSSPVDPGPSREASPPLSEDALVAVVTGGGEARQIPRVCSRRRRPGPRGPADRAPWVGEQAQGPRPGSPCSPAPARCGRPRGQRSSAPACCWRWWPAQTRWRGRRTGLQEKGSGENELRALRGALRGAGVERDTDSPQAETLPATLPVGPG